MKPDNKTKAICVELPVKIIREAKIDAAKRGVTLQKWYADAASQRIKDSKESEIPGVWA